jgi:hypothetical protein
MPATFDAAAALTDALVALAKAERAINLALAALGADAPAPVTRQEVAVRTTSTQVLAVLSAAGEPLPLIDVADGILALRRGEDEPKKGGGTRYQEMTRTAIARLVERGLVERVPPADKRGLMKFRRTAIGVSHDAP